jgi:hypothetical protein
MILRAAKQEAVYLFANTADTHVRVRYMHMNPKLLDADGILSGKTMKAGERLGLVANYNEYERGTTYHLHFDMQVPTRIGWVFVNPYMALVASYEQLIGARGMEIKDGDQVPPATTMPPVILNPDIKHAAAPTPVQSDATADTPKEAATPPALPEPKPPQTNVSERKNTQKADAHEAKPRKAKPRKRHVRRRHKRFTTAEE